MATAMDGIFQASTINNSKYDGIDYSTPIDISLITVPDLREELLAVEEFYRDKGYAIHLRQPENGRSGTVKGDHRIQFRYDYENGGFHMNYTPRVHTPTPSYHNIPTVGQTCQRMRDSVVVAHVHACRQETHSKVDVAMLEYNTYNRVVAAHLSKRCHNRPMVIQVIHAQGNEFKAPDTTRRDHGKTAIWAHHPWT